MRKCAPTEPFTTLTVWNAGLVGTGVAAAGRSLTVGREGDWRPEHLLLLAAESCFMSTLIALAANADVEVLGYVSTGHLSVPDNERAMPTLTLSPCIVVATAAEATVIWQLVDETTQTSAVVRALGDRLRVTADVQLIPSDARR